MKERGRKSERRTKSEREESKGDVGQKETSDCIKTKMKKEKKEHEALKFEEHQVPLCAKLTHENTGIHTVVYRHVRTFTDVYRQCFGPFSIVQT